MPCTPVMCPVEATIAFLCWCAVKQSISRFTHRIWWASFRWTVVLPRGPTRSCRDPYPKTARGWHTVGETLNSASPRGLCTHHCIWTRLPRDTTSIDNNYIQKKTVGIMQEFRSLGLHMKIKLRFESLICVLAALHTCILIYCCWYNTVVVYTRILKSIRAMEGICKWDYGILWPQ